MIRLQAIDRPMNGLGRLMICMGAWVADEEAGGKCMVPSGASDLCVLAVRESGWDVLMAVSTKRLLEIPGVTAIRALLPSSCLDGRLAVTFQD